MYILWPIEHMHVRRVNLVSFICLHCNLQYHYVICNQKRINVADPIIKVNIQSCDLNIDKLSLKSNYKNLLELELGLLCTSETQVTVTSNK